MSQLPASTPLAPSNALYQALLGPSSSPEARAAMEQAVLLALEAGANPNAHREDNTVLALALRARSVASVAALVERGARFDPGCFAFVAQVLQSSANVTLSPEFGDLMRALAPAPGDGWQMACRVWSFSALAKGAERVLPLEQVVDWTVPGFYAYRQECEIARGLPQGILPPRVRI